MIINFIIEFTINFTQNLDYLSYQEKLYHLYEKKAIDQRRRRRCNWSQHGKKSTKFSFNPAKSWISQNTVRKYIENEKKTSRRNS